jgi:hypothetical protein
MEFNWHDERTLIPFMDFFKRIYVKIVSIPDDLPQEHP